MFAISKIEHQSSELSQVILGFIGNRLRTVNSVFKEFGTLLESRHFCELFIDFFKLRTKFQIRIFVWKIQIRNHSALVEFRKINGVGEFEARNLY